MDKKEKKVSINVKHREYKFNQFGRRVIVNWCRYAQYLTQRERERNRKIVKVSRVTEEDAMIFEDALERLREERKRLNRATYTCCSKRPTIEEEKPSECDCEKSDGNPRSRPVKTLKKSKSILSKSRSVSRSRSLTRRSNSLKNRKTKSQTQCRSRSRSRTKSALKKCKCDSKTSIKKEEVKEVRKIVINYPEIKRKTWIPPHLIPRSKPERVVVKIPPFKTRPWDPCSIIEKKVEKKEKPKIEYPPVKLRKT